MTLPLTGSDYQRAVEQAHGELLSFGDPGLSSLGGVRHEVVQSWHRSLLAHGGQRTHGGARLKIEPGMVGDADLRDVRRDNPLAVVLPVIRNLLVDSATEAGLIVAVGNADGRLLWVEGDPIAQRRAESMGFVAGADWSETSVGTSAPGVALYTGRASQVSRAEHFHPIVHPWSCSAVPLRDPVEGRIAGVIDLTGGDEAVSPLALPLLTATAQAVQSAWKDHLLSQRNAGPLLLTSSGNRRDCEGQTPALRVTGGQPARYCAADGEWRELTGKHAEILTLLAWHGTGLDGAELEDLIYGHEAGTTLRAEMHRLRRMLQTGLAGVSVLSRPYRLEGEVTLDAVRARDALRRGDLATALDHASGPILPRSTAPGIIDLRHQLGAALREAVAQDADVEQLWSYLGRPEAADDLQLWMTALQLLPADSPRRALAVSTVERLQSAGI